MSTLLTFLLACGGESPAPDAPAEGPVEVPTEPPVASPAHQVSFVEPADGAKVKPPVKVVFAVEGMTIEPAGTLKDGTGHHHLIIDGAAVPAGTAVPMDDQHIHFGQGQTETTIQLGPGPHTLTMQFADGNHVSYGPDMSATVKIEVE